MGCVGRCQGQAHAYSIGLPKDGLSFSFLDSRRPCSLVLRAAGALVLAEENNKHGAARWSKLYNVRS